MSTLVEHGSVVRRIWGNSDLVLLVFAGSAAEFALNRAVDWLFFTGKLPGDPIGRLFATASYAQYIVFADDSTASRTLDRIRAAHETVERKRGQSIPDWAHRDVLYMLIDYSERAREPLAQPLTAPEQDELYDVFYRVGLGLRIPALPASYSAWRADREIHLLRDLENSDGTKALYAQYRHHLGDWPAVAHPAPAHAAAISRRGPCAGSAAPHAPNTSQRANRVTFPATARSSASVNGTFVRKISQPARILPPGAPRSEP